MKTKKNFLAKQGFLREIKSLLDEEDDKNKVFLAKHA